VAVALVRVQCLSGLVKLPYLGYWHQYWVYPFTTACVSELIACANQTGHYLGNSDHCGLSEARQLQHLQGFCRNIVIVKDAAFHTLSWPLELTSMLAVSIKLYNLRLSLLQLETCMRAAVLWCAALHQSCLGTIRALSACITSTHSDSHKQHPHRTSLVNAA
jgi:hypothetical protein